MLFCFLQQPFILFFIFIFWYLKCTSAFTCYLQNGSASAFFHLLSTVTSGAGREPWERSEAGGVDDNERHLRHSPVSSPTEELRKDKRRSDDSGRRERTRPGL